MYRRVARDTIKVFESKYSPRPFMHSVEDYPGVPCAARCLIGCLRKFSFWCRAQFRTCLFEIFINGSLARYASHELIPKFPVAVRHGAAYSRAPLACDANYDFIADNSRATRATLAGQ